MTPTSTLTLIVRGTEALYRMETQETLQRHIPRKIQLHKKNIYTIFACAELTQIAIISFITIYFSVYVIWLSFMSLLHFIYLLKAEYLFVVLVKRSTIYL